MWKEELAKLRKMKFEEKIEYLWNNYMAQIVLTFFLLVMAVVAGNFIYQKLHPNTNANIALLDYDGYADMLETDGICVETFQGLSAETLESPDYGDLRMGVLAKIATGDLDGMIASRETIEKLQGEKDETFQSLSKVYSDKELHQMQDKLLYLTDSNGSSYAVGISLTDAAFLSGLVPQADDIYLVFTITGTHTDTVKQWIATLW